MQEIDSRQLQGSYCGAIAQLLDSFLFKERKMKIVFVGFAEQ
ncbi:MAG: hypothetical protein SW833_18645 [Cyanobacteriota bacterium]|nr:hypothetical protein [Cyanobacteriota bacterium]